MAQFSNNVGLQINGGNFGQIAGMYKRTLPFSFADQTTLITEHHYHANLRESMLLRQWETELTVDSPG